MTNIGNRLFTSFEIFSENIFLGRFLVRFIQTRATSQEITPVIIVESGAASHYTILGLVKAVLEST